MLLVRDSKTVLDAFNSEDGKNTLAKHFCRGNEDLRLEKDDIWLGDVWTEERLTADGDAVDIEHFTKKRHLGAMCALSTFWSAKGIERAQAGYDTIFLDEFIPESRQADRIDTVRAFYRTLQSTLRTKPDAVVLMAANLVSDSPLWDMLGVRPGKPGEITCNPRTGVVCEHVLPDPTWVRAHKMSVAGRLGIDDYNTGGKVNPNIIQLHAWTAEKSRVYWTNNSCRKLTNDGTDVVYVFNAFRTWLENGELKNRQDRYCCCEQVGESILAQEIDRGMRVIPWSRVTTMGYRREPKSKFDSLSLLVNDILFENKKTLEKFERICR